MYHLYLKLIYFFWLQNIVNLYILYKLVHLYTKKRKVRRTFSLITSHRKGDEVPFEMRVCLKSP